MIIDMVYACESCDGQAFTMYISHEDDRTYLITVCANQECVQGQRIRVGAKDNELIFIDKFDITGQGRDLEDIPEDIMEEIREELEEAQEKRKRTLN